MAHHHSGPTPLTAEEFTRRASRSWCVLPTGAVEQHGPHLPIQTDALLAEGIAREVAERTGSALLPALAYGYRSQPRSGGGNHLPGTVSLTGATLIAVVRDLVSELLDKGARQVAVVNGHYENYQFVYDGVAEALRARASGRGADSRVVLLSYWDYVSEDTLAAAFPAGFPGWATEHGGVLETSLMLHLHPELVTEPLPSGPLAEQRRYDVLPERPEWTPPSGCLSPATGSSAKVGRLIFDDVVAGITATLEAERRPDGTTRPG